MVRYRTFQLRYTAQAGDWVTCATYADKILVGPPGDQTCSDPPCKPCIGGATFAVEGKKYSFWDTDLIESSSWFTFIGMHEHPILGNLGFAPEYFLPILIGFFVSSAETIGDIGMSCIASRLPTEGADYNSRIQGGLLADGVNSLAGQTRVSHLDLRVRCVKLLTRKCEFTFNRFTPKCIYA